MAEEKPEPRAWLSGGKIEGLRDFKISDVGEELFVEAESFDPDREIRTDITGSSSHTISMQIDDPEKIKQLTKMFAGDDGRELFMRDRTMTILRLEAMEIFVRAKIPPDRQELFEQSVQEYANDLAETMFEDLVQEQARSYYTSREYSEQMMRQGMRYESVHDRYNRNRPNGT